ncbi:conserved hypothetical protein [Gammaproteobacteria bacterium]
MTALAVRHTEPENFLDQDAFLARLTPLLHSPESTEGTPYYDEEFEMAQSIAHGRTIYFLMELLNRVASRAGLSSVSDNPVWYLDWEGNRKVLYPDYALTASQNLYAITARELLLALEVVSTSRSDKERKDSVRMRNYNAINRVPEFVLIYPEPEDKRSVVWYQYDTRIRSYREVTLPANRRYCSKTIPGLEIEVLEPQEWTEGRKIRVYYLGEEVQEGQNEYEARKLAVRQAEQERLAKEVVQRQAEQERFAKEAAQHQTELAERRAGQERLAKEAAQRQAEQERLAKEAAQHQTELAERQAGQERLAKEMAQRQAEQERLAKEAAEQQIQELLARLKQAGVATNLRVG